MLSAASTHKLATSSVALSLAFAIVVAAPALALGEAARHSGSESARVGNWAGAPPVNRKHPNSSVDAGLKIRIIERAGDQQSCRNTLFVPARPRKCQSSREIAYGDAKDLRTNSLSQKALDSDSTAGTAKLERPRSDKSLPPKAIARLDAEPPKGAKPKLIVKPQPVQPDALGKEEPQSPTSLPCDKAAAIVGDYGFKSVQSSDCEGQVFSFNASRDGKPFIIALDSVNGELIKVQKAPVVAP